MLKPQTPSPHNKREKHPLHVHLPYAPTKPGDSCSTPPARRRNLEMLPARPPFPVSCTECRKFDTRCQALYMHFQAVRPAARTFLDVIKKHKNRFIELKTPLCAFLFRFMFVFLRTRNHTSRWKQKSTGRNKSR